MDRIINGMDRTINPAIDDGASKIIEIINVISNNSSLPLRSNWRNIPSHLLSAKEILATTDRFVRKNRSNWLALEHLPEANWLNGQVLVGSCKKWNYSRWSSAGSDSDLIMEECQSRLSPRVSLAELRVALTQNMLCFNERAKHFYSRKGNLEADFDILTDLALDKVLCALKPADAPFLDLIGNPPPPLPICAPDEDDDNVVIPVSRWDGLLTADLILRPNNDHKVLDLQSPADRRKLAESIRKMPFLDAHDAHTIAEELEGSNDGFLPEAPKMKISEMMEACKLSNSSFISVENDISTVVVEGTSPDVVTYNRDLNRYSLNSASPATPSIITGDSLISINWNCNSWDFHKSQKVAELANVSKADIIMVTDTRIDHWRLRESVDRFAKTLQLATGKIWNGEATPKHLTHRMGGNLIMHSNRISKPKISHLLPLGILSSIDGKWKKQDFCLLSIYRPPEDGGDTSLRALASDAIGSDMEPKLWDMIENRMNMGPTWLCGDFNLAPSKLDDFLVGRGNLYRRIPFSGEYRSFRRWDSVNEHMQQSSLDHLVWNGQGRPSCTLAADGWFATDHTPVVLNSGLQSDDIHIKPTELKHNPSLNCNDKGACRKFLLGMERFASSGRDIDLLSLQDITDQSLKIVQNINKRRNNSRSPSIWSPLAHILNLRVSALGSTIRSGLKGDISSLKSTIGKLRRDEMAVTLNEDEREWLDSNGIESEPFDWQEWTNQFSHTSIAARELIRLKKLLSQENRKEFRRLHSERMCRLQEQADSGKIGGIIKNIMGRPSSFTMESIRQGEETITDGKMIAKLITSFFSQWFARLPEEKDRDKRLSECVLGNDLEGWNALTTSCGIPPEVSSTLWGAFAPKQLSEDGRRDAAGLSEYVPSLDEFKRYIGKLNPRSAPGFSGLSYLMVKLWPDSLIDRAYECLREAWLERKGLKGWGIRLLAPIPKKPNPELKDLRPLMLVEVMRKIWVGLITSHVTSFLMKHHLINDNQHAYLRGKGTHTAVPQLINAMETAKEYCTDLYISSWDMSKAFDNLSREMILLCLRRLHIPLDIAEYFISLDVDGKVIVRAPWILHRSAMTGLVVSPFGLYSRARPSPVS
jgi:hypothetical protein